jgi:hypothetical protein
MSRSTTPKKANGSLSRIPTRRVGPWAKEVIQECAVSRQDRILQAETMRNFYFTGTADGTAGIDNEIFPEIDQLSSSLFSPVDPRFAIGFDRNETAENRALGDSAAAYLSRCFRRRGVDDIFAEAVNWGLVESAAFVKLLWGRHGFDPYLVSQAFMGVFNEGSTDLDHQDAFVHTTFVTPAAFERAIKGHPEEASIIRQVRRSAAAVDPDEASAHSGLRRLLIGGTIPVNLTPPQQSQPAGWVQWIRGPTAVLSPQTLASLIQIDELWVIDNEREDYTTFQLAGDIVIEGKLQRRNLCGVKGSHPFTPVIPNPVPTCFWGRSEVANLMMPQEAISAQVNGINRVMRMQEDPPLSFQGVSGDIGEKRSALMKPGGRISELNPQFKIENHAPKLVEGAAQWAESLREIFHRTGGFEAPISRGQSDQGMRSAVQADTMVRMASPRIRDRAIGIERTYIALGDFGFQLLRAKVPDRFEVTVKGQPQPVSFTLDQVPDDYDLSVDSHSSSPAFANDARNLALQLARLKAIDDVDTIRLTHPPQEDTLVANAEERKRQQAAFMAQHPELLQKHSAHR